MFNINPVRPAINATALSFTQLPGTYADCDSVTFPFSGTATLFGDQVTFCGEVTNHVWQTACRLTVTNGSESITETFEVSGHECGDDLSTGTSLLRDWVMTVMYARHPRGSASPFTS